MRRGHAHVLHFVVRPEARAAAREHGPAGLMRASWVECPAFEDDRGRGPIPKKGDAGDAEACESLGDVGPDNGFPGVTVGDEHDRGHQDGFPPSIVVSTWVVDRARP
jgi:hypothetical protein